MRIAVIGAGSWGTALAQVLAQKEFEVCLWTRDSEQAECINNQRRNNRYLKDIELAPRIQGTSELKVAVKGAEMIVMAVASQGVRQVLEKMAPWVEPNQPVVNVSKGIETKTLKRMSEIVGEFLPANPYCVLSGPSHAEEVANNMPTTLVSACKSRGIAEWVQDVFSTAYLRVYTNPDVAGVELAGSLKNIIAIGAGISDGLGYGDNAKAALITRGITEIGRLGLVLGAKTETFAGLAGIGDLIVTCTSGHSRNRRFGMLIGQGVAATAALEQIGMVVEGYYTTKSAYDLSQKHAIEMPIVQELYNILYLEGNAQESVSKLMLRSLKHESEWLAKTGQWG